MVLTGFIGERTNRRVALVTDDFRTYHELAPYFEEHGITILGIPPGDEVPGSVRAIIGGPDGDPRTVAIAATPAATLLRVYQRLDPRIDTAYRLVKFGVDPGDTIGLAVMCDGAVFLTDQCHDVETAVIRIGQWMGALVAESFRIHVGDGAPAVGGRVAEAAKRLRIPAVFVPEQASSPSTPATQSRHTDAAIHIAMREP